MNLPGYNCKQCGYDTCLELPKDKYDLCVFLNGNSKCSTKSIMDKIEPDFVLGPYPDEPSCREFVLPLKMVPLKVGDIVRYRPLGCPITHFARVFQANEGEIYIGIHLIGPLTKQDHKDLGICLVLAFEGIVVEGRVPDPCETVRFLPERCMMSKIHTAVCTHSEGKKVRLDGIGLAVWERPK